MCSVDGDAAQIVLQSRRELVEAKRSGTCRSLSFRHIELEKSFRMRADAVVLGWEYRCAFPQCMAGLIKLIDFDRAGEHIAQSECALQGHFRGSGDLYPERWNAFAWNLCSRTWPQAYRNDTTINRWLGVERYPASTKPRSKQSASLIVGAWLP